MKEEIKIALLAIIAGTLIIQTYMAWENSDNTGTVSTATSPVTSSTITPSGTTPPNQVAENKPELPKTSIKFLEETFDFGSIKQETENKHVFKFKNTGTNPLVIENAHGSCGCTVPTWPKDPVQPGADGEIEVDYKPGKQQGKQTKTVTVIANTEPKETKVTIIADVQVPPGS